MGGGYCIKECAVNNDCDICGDLLGECPDCYSENLPHTGWICRGGECGEETLTCPAYSEEWWMLHCCYQHRLSGWWGENECVPPNNPLPGSACIPDDMPNCRPIPPRYVTGRIEYYCDATCRVADACVCNGDAAYGPPTTVGGENQYGNPRAGMEGGSVFWVIEWRENTTANLTHLMDFIEDGDIFVDTKLAAVRTGSVMDLDNTSAEVHFYDITCNDFTLYKNPSYYTTLFDIINSGSGGEVIATEANVGGNCNDINEDSIPECLNISCSFDYEHSVYRLDFIVSNFSSHGIDSESGGNDPPIIPEFSTIGLILSMLIAITAIVWIVRRK